MRWPDVDLEAGVVQIARQRARDGDGTDADEGQAVPLGPDRTAARGDARGVSGTSATRGEPTTAAGCSSALRRAAAGTRAGPSPSPPSRKTAHDWHEWALQDAGLRDMPLHSLRHTAATAWLATGHPLIFVQRQLGHRSITTTEEHYGHFEASFVREAAARTEAADCGGRAPRGVMIAFR